MLKTADGKIVKDVGFRTNPGFPQMKILALDSGTAPAGMVCITSCIVRQHAVNSHFGTVHGGNLARLFVKEGKNAAIAAGGGMCRTRNLNITYRNPAYRGEALFVEATIGNKAGSDMLVKVEVKCDRSGKLVPIADGRLALTSEKMADGIHDTWEYPEFWKEIVRGNAPRQVYKELIVRHTITEEDLRGDSFGEQKVAWLTDNTGGHAGQFHECKSVTGKMEISYFQPVRIEDRLCIVAEVVRMSGCKIYSEVSISFESNPERGLAAKGYLVLVSANKEGAVPLPDSVLNRPPVAKLY